MIPLASWYTSAFSETSKKNLGMVTSENFVEAKPMPVRWFRNDTTQFSGFREVVRHGVHVEAHKAGRFHDVRNRARFLFGKEVTDWLKVWHENLIDMTTSAEMFKEQDPSPERQHHVSAAYDSLKKVLRFPEQFPQLCEPYMKMDQKRVRTPSEWFKDKNKQRLSYSDSTEPK